MDLSNLSNHLPPTSPITEESIEKISNEITTNFKDLAKSVLALYRLSQSKNALLINKGYLDCLDDILKIMSSDGDVENWVLLKRNELVNLNKNGTMAPTPANEIGSDAGPGPSLGQNQGSYPGSGSDSEREVDVCEKPNATVEKSNLVVQQPNTNTTAHFTVPSSSFKLNNVTPAPFKFPPTMVPLSFSHSNIHYFHRKKPVRKSPENSSHDDEEEEVAEQSELADQAMEDDSNGDQEHQSKKKRGPVDYVNGRKVFTLK